MHSQVDLENYYLDRELDERHSWGMAYHWLSHRLKWWTTPAPWTNYQRMKWLARRRYQDMHEEGHEPRRVVLIECMVCGGLFTESHLWSCMWCREDLCAACSEEHGGCCTPECLSSFEWSLSRH